MDDESKNRRGGARKGAGRPRTDSRLFTFRASDAMARYIEGKENKTDFIKSCIQRVMLEDLPRLEWGSVFPASRLKKASIPFFDIGIVAGFPVPLDNDERAQDIDLLRMLCPHPESSYLIRVEGHSMRDAGIRSGDIVIVDKSNRNPTEKQVAVCEFNGEYTLKHFVKPESSVDSGTDYSAELKNKFVAASEDIAENEEKYGKQLLDGCWKNATDYVNNKKAASTAQPGGNPENRIFDNTLSWAGWTGDAPIFLGALNSSELSTNHTLHLPVYKFQSKASLDRFIEKHRDSRYSGRHQNHDDEWCVCDERNHSSDSTEHDRSKINFGIHTRIFEGSD